MDVLSNGLTEKQKELFSKLTRLQQTFLKYYLVSDDKERNATQSYRQAKEELKQNPPKNDNAAAASASTMLNNSKVQAFVKEMESQAVAKLEQTLIMGRQEMAERLTKMGRFDLTDVVKLSNIEVEDAEENIHEQTIATIKDLDGLTKDDTIGLQEIKINGKTGDITIKTHDQKAAMKQLSEIMGYNREVEGDDAKLTQEELLLQMIDTNAVMDEKLD